MTSTNLGRAVGLNSTDVQALLYNDLKAGRIERIPGTKPILYRTTDLFHAWEREQLTGAATLLRAHGWRVSEPVSLENQA